MDAPAAWISVSVSMISVLPSTRVMTRSCCSGSASTFTS
jgi:hypothetical protein